MKFCNNLMDDNLYIKLHSIFNNATKSLLGIDLDEKLDNGEILQNDYEEYLLKIYEGVKDV